MITYYAIKARALRYRTRRIGRWIYRHPRWSAAITSVTLWVSSIVFGNVYARAADGAAADGAGGGWLAGLTAADSSGVAVWQYLQLPIDRGDIFNPQKTIIGTILDIIWIGHVGAISWMITFLDWLISFEWVTWLATPLNDIATRFETYVDQLDWIPFALLIAAGVAGFAMWTGRAAAGFLDLMVSVMCATLAVGVLANPIATITGEDGALMQMKNYGNEIAVAVTTDQTTPDDATGNGNTKPPAAEDILSDTVTSQLVTIFIRIPAQTISFGHSLLGDCDQVFTDQMKATGPIRIGDNTVRDKVGDCDAAAKYYVQNPSYGQVLSAGIISLGGANLFLLALGLSLLFIGTVIFTFWEAFKAMVNVLVAILPATGRLALWSSIAGVAMGLLSVVGMLIILAAYLTVIVSLLKLSASLGIVMQMNFVNIVIVVLLFILWKFRRSAKKAGESMAKRLAKLGLGNDAPKPVNGSLFDKAAKAGQLATNYMAYKSLSGGPKSAPAAARPAASAQGPIDIGNLTATPKPRDAAPSQLALAGGVSGGGGGSSKPAEIDKASQVADLALTAAKIAKAAPGGLPAMIGQGAVSVGQSVASKAIAGQVPAAAPAPTESVPPASRRIVVDQHGVGHVRRAVRDTTVYDISSLPKAPPRSARNLAMRATLADSAAR